MLEIKKCFQPLFFFHLYSVLFVLMLIRFIFSPLFLKINAIKSTNFPLMYFPV